MKKKQTNWVAAALLTAAMFIATIYCIAVYRDSVFIVGIISLLFLGSAFWLFTCISKMISSNQSVKPSVGEEQRERMNYEGMKLQGEELIRLVNTIGKGTYVNSKRSAERLEKLLTQYVETQQANEQLIRTLIAEQTKAAKFQMKYNQSDTGKVIAALNSQCSRLNDSLSQCVTAIQNKSVNIPAPQDNSQVAESLHTLSLELNRINSSIQALQIQLNMTAQPVTYSSVQPQSAPISQVPTTELQTDSTMQNAASMANVEKSAIISEESVDAVKEDTVIDEPTADAEESAAIDEPTADAEKSAAIDEPTADAEKSAAIDEPETDVSSIISEDSNKQLSPDEIAALFAALG